MKRQKVRGEKIYQIYAISFLSILFVLAILSDLKLVKFYVNNEVSYNERKADVRSRFETDYITNFYGKIHLINVNGAIRSVLQQREMNGVVKLSNGYLSEAVGEFSEEVLQKSAENIADIERACTERGISFLYVMTPYKISKYDLQLPTGIEDYSNQNMDYFLQVLAEQNVNYMDMREIIYADGIDQYDLFYRTDHHWTTEGGFYAYTMIAEYLGGMLNVEIPEDIQQLDNYVVTEYDKWHLGSHGQRVGVYYGGIDDFNLIEPDFETRLYHHGTGEEGTFSELLITTWPLRNRNYESRYTYDYVLGNCWGHFTNELAQCDSRILVISDSMGKAVIPYMILSFSDVYGIYAYEPEVVDEAFLEEYQPDAVVIIEYPKLLENDTLYSFFTCAEE